MKPLIVVHHVPKTSGSTMRGRFIDNLGPERVYWHIADGHIMEDIDRLRSLGDQLLVVGGHIHFDVIERLAFERKIIRFSMVRDPTNLLLSARNYVGLRPEHPNYTNVPPDDPAILDTGFYKRYSSTQCHTMTSFVYAGKAIERLWANPFVVTTNDRVEELFTHAMTMLGEPVTKPMKIRNVGSRDYSWFNEERARQILASGAKEDRRLFDYITERWEGWLNTAA